MESAEEQDDFDSGDADPYRAVFHRPVVESSFLLMSFDHILVQHKHKLNWICS